MGARLTIVSASGATKAGSLGEHLTPEIQDAGQAAGNAFIKSLRLAPYGADTMRSRFRYRDDSLWWFTELYLHKTRRLERAVTTVLALEALAQAEAPRALRVQAADPVTCAVAAAFGEARGLTVDVTGGSRETRARAWPSYLIGLTASLSRLRPSPDAGRAAATGPRARVAAFVHSAFAAARDAGAVPAERYIGAVLDALAHEAGAGAVRCVGIGPRRNFRARRWWDPIVGGVDVRDVTPIERLAPARTLTESRAFWRRRRGLAREIVAGDGIRDAARFRGVDLWTVLAPELEAVALLQWPWSVRAMDEAGAALEALSPDVAVTYAEAGGWGRALVLEARRRGIPIVGLQHGFIYRHWLNYRHEPDEALPKGADAGFPFPTRTLVFDRFTGDQLASAGSFPAGRVEVTGSPQLDRLSARIGSMTPDERRRLRSAWHVASDDAPLALLVAKGTEIAAVLPELRAAFAAQPGARLVVKPHPAETPAAYDLLASLPNVTIAPGDADLADLAGASDLVVTRNSTVAVDALALGRAVLVVGLPSNLSPFVDAGAMRGAAPGQVAGALEALLYDRQARLRLAASAAAFATSAGMRADGRAAERAARAILDLMPA
jgi:hypothetical protein